MVQSHCVHMPSRTWTVMCNVHRKCVILMSYDSRYMYIISIRSPICMEGRDFSRLFWGRISASFPMEKWPVFSQKVDEISQSDAPRTFSDYFSLIQQYLGHSKMTISGLW